MSRKRTPRAPSGASRGTVPLSRSAPSQPPQLPVPREEADSVLAMPHDPALVQAVRQDWLAGRWDALEQRDPQTLQQHPDRAALLAYQAASAVQAGDRAAALMRGRQALAWGCSRQELARLLLAGAHHTLGRAAYLARKDDKAQAHFGQALSEARLGSEVRRHALARTDQVSADLRAAVSSSAALRRAGMQPATSSAPAWLVGMAERCLGAPDPHDAIDQALAGELTLVDDQVRFLILLSEKLGGRGDRMSALHFLNTARTHAQDIDPELRAELMRRLVALHAAPSAIDLAIEAGLASAMRQHDASAARSLKAAYEQMRDAASAHEEHGHELLLRFLQLNGAALRAKAPARPLVLIEIGTTREDVPGQGSTRKLAEYCLAHGMHFITVDMDPHNSRMASDTFARLDAPFEAVTMKGEDYLRERAGPVDLVFLDAYDYDHGMHSDLRQSRYERFLGARIDEQACHQMHLDCARSLATKLWEHGVMCVDDTWREGAGWAAKGTLAVPFLLEQGFQLIDERNRAVLMTRTPHATPAQSD